MALFNETAHPQAHDHTWLLGYSTLDDPTDTAWGITILDFNTLNGLPDVVYDGYKIIDFDYTNANISDQHGNYLFSYNGTYIEDRSNEIMKGGNNLSNSGNEFGDILDQGGLILPWKENLYMLVHQSWDYIENFGSAGEEVFYSVIDMDGNGGLGEVISKKNLILKDTLDYGKITAARHANGRDWWVLFPEYDTNTYVTMLLTPEGLSVTETQAVGAKNRAGFGQAVFSPDGSHYAKFSAIQQNVGSYYDLYDFDRCTGRLSNHHQIRLLPGVIPGGLAYSPDSRYLYISHDRHIYQLDIHNNDYELREVAAYDGYISYPGGGFQVATLFGLMQIGPDGRIYCTPTYASVRELHVINSPNRAGAACDVRQHSLHLPTLQTCLPNFPNYRLGPVDGSPCDTLGLDNLPLAKFRYDQDSTDYLTIEFTNLSYYEPTKWSWDFGDNTSSQDTNPVHTYPFDDIYVVCLTVSNEYGDNTFCQSLQLGAVDTGKTEANIFVEVFPNPCQHETNIILGGSVDKNIESAFFDATGRLVQSQQLEKGWNKVPMDNLPSGVYFYEIMNNGKFRQSGKLVKVD